MNRDKNIAHYDVLMCVDTARTAEERAAQAVTAKLLGIYSMGQKVKQRDQEGIYGRVITDEGDRIAIRTRNGFLSIRHKNYIELLP